MKNVQDVWTSNRAVKGERVRAIECEIERIVEAEDKCFEDRMDDYGEHLIEKYHQAEVLKCFEENYSSRSIGRKPWDHLDSAEVLKLLRDFGQTDAQIVEMILNCSEPQTCDYYIQWNEMASVQIGEMEYQIDFEGCPDLVAAIEAATPEERLEAGIKPRDLESGSLLVYGNPCDRIIWKLDPEEFLGWVVDTCGADPEHDEVVP